MIGRWDTNGNERISCDDPRVRRDISGDRAKHPALDCAVPGFGGPADRRSACRKILRGDRF